MVVDVYNLKREKVGEIELADAVFNADVKQHLMHEVVRAQRASRRSGTACVKERNAVSGGGRKPYRQKGTGRARQGSRRAPNHVGGGVIHGPRPRSYAFRPPRNVRRGALRSALSLRVKEEKILVLEDFELEEIGTKRLSEILAGLEVEGGLLVDRVGEREAQAVGEKPRLSQLSPARGRQCLRRSSARPARDDARRRDESG